MDTQCVEAVFWQCPFKATPSEAAHVCSQEMVSLQTMFPLCDHQSSVGSLHTCSKTWFQADKIKADACMYVKKKGGEHMHYICMLLSQVFLTEYFIHRRKKQWCANHNSTGLGGILGGLLEPLNHFHLLHVSHLCVMYWACFQ